MSDFKEHGRNTQWSDDYRDEGVKPRYARLKWIASPLLRRLDKRRMAKNRRADEKRFLRGYDE